ncbi:MAG: hypothetical protein ACSHWY_00325 [Octadecabacter sp.]
MIYTASDIADAIAKARSLSEDAKKKTLREIRHHQKRERITPTAEPLDARGTAGFSKRNVAKAAILTGLSRLGVSDKALDGVAIAMEMASDPRLELPVIDGTWPPRGLDAVLAADDMQDWKLFLMMKEDTDAVQFVLGGFVRADQQPYLESDPRSGSAMWAEEGLNILMEMTITCDRLVAPVLATLPSKD